jgi:Holliday junction resolvase RusA-like endonuclease
MPVSNNYEYEINYGNLPNAQEELVRYLRDNLKYNEDKLLKEEERIKEIPWKELEYTIYTVPKGSPRPKYSSRNGVFYVKGAKATKNFFRKMIEAEGLICTRVEINIDAYLPTPVKSMTATEVILAEEGLIRPISTPDFDNIAKTYTDALQDILLFNDNIINPGRVEKFYSIKPRLKIILRYQTEFDSAYNRRKTENGAKYKKDFNTEG